MSSLVDIRTDLAQFLAAALGVTVHRGPQTAVSPPCGVLQPHPSEDYLSPEGWGAEVVRLRLVLLAEDGDPLAVLDAIDDMLDKVRPVLQYGQSPAGRTYTFGPAGPPGRFTAGSLQLPGVEFDITTTRTVEAPSP